jgi:hypothetical protein
MHTPNLLLEHCTLSTYFDESVSFLSNFEWEHNNVLQYYSTNS